eukprot:s454_g3.t1
MPQPNSHGSSAGGRLLHDTGVPWNLAPALAAPTPCNGQAITLKAASELWSAVHENNTPEEPMEEPSTLDDERQFLHQRFEKLRHDHPGFPQSTERVPFGVAFSGGGVRAAAFHCGLLWSLAAENVLKDVSHLASVSGGAYTAACYVTHLLKQPEAAPGTPLDVWYKEVVAKTILRMQNNINYLVRIGRCRPDQEFERGRGCCPRIFDIPFFVLTIIATACISPALIFINTVWPLVLCIEHELAATLRSAWCDPVHRAYSPALYQWSKSRLIYFAGVTLAAGILLALLARLGCCRPNREHYLSHLFRRSMQQVLIRGAICYSIYVTVPWILLQMQNLSWGTQGVLFSGGSQEGSDWVRFYCWRYIQENVNAPSCIDYMQPFHGALWFDDGHNYLYRNATWVAQHHIASPSGTDPGGDTQYTTPMFLVINLLIFAAGLIGLLWGLSLLRWYLTLAGPIWAAFLVALVAQWQIFGPLTGQALFPNLLYYSYSSSSWIFHVCVIAAVITLPIYDLLIKLIHSYYRRSLQLAYFCDGEDIEFPAAADSPYCPNLLLGACINDFRRPALHLEDVQRFYSLLNTREAIRKRRQAGLHGRHLYQGLTGEFAEYLQHYKSTNVHRADDATTRGLHALCAAEKRLQICRPEDTELVKRQIVMNFAVWRLIGGTTAFAGEVGFLTNWGASEKSCIRDIIAKGFKDNRVPTLLSNAYSWPRTMRQTLTYSNANADSLEMVLHNRGKLAVKGAIPIANATLVGKFKVLDVLWEVSPEVIEAAKPDEHGRTSMERVGNVLKAVPFFGSGVGCTREAGFFAKELIQDLVDTPVFPGGRTTVADHSSYCPVGPGSINGLKLVFRRKSIHPSETLPMIQALHSFAGDFFEGSAQELDLHDIQFQLCEFQKLVGGLSLTADLGGPMDWTPCFVFQRLREMLELLNDERPQFLQQDPASVRHLSKKLCSWLGVSFRQSESLALTHGDVATIQEMSSGSFFSVMKNGSLTLVDEEAASSFVLTTDNVQVGAIHFWDPIYLETQGCKQLAWQERKKCLGAKSDSRFDPSHRLTLQPINPMDSISQIRESAPNRAVLQSETVRLESLDSGRQKDLDDPPLVVRLRRPEQILAREERFMELMQGAEDKELLSDFTLSPLFMGCPRTGFFRTDRRMRLGYAISVSGAAPDTLMLTKFDVLPIRFLLSVFSLRLGDFVRLAPDGKIAKQIGTTFRRLEERAAPSAAGNEVRAATAQFLVQRVWDGAPVMLGRGLDDVGSCGAYHVILQMGLSGFVVVLVLSFFAFAPQLRWLMRSPLILQFQMMFMHRHQAIRPPPYVYVSDGGLIECLGVLLLLRRRMPLIICSDACEDMNVTLRALLDTIHLARAEKLCSFFDVRDPRRDVQLSMAEVRHSRCPYLRLGIRYEPTEAGGEAMEGELLYIRMRLAPDDGAPERGLLEKAELTGEPIPPPGSTFDLGNGCGHRGGYRAENDAMPPRREMNGLWCSGPCARRCPGRRFPDFGTGNQFLQPRHLANLCALGAEMSLPAVKYIAQKIRPDGTPPFAAPPSVSESVYQRLVESLRDWAEVLEEPRHLRLLRSKATAEPMTSILRRSMLAVDRPAEGGKGALETCRLLRSSDQLSALERVTQAQFEAAEQCLGLCARLDPDDAASGAAAPGAAALLRLAQLMLQLLAARFRPQQVQTARTSRRPVASRPATGEGLRLPPAPPPSRAPMSPMSPSSPEAVEMPLPETVRKQMAQGHLRRAMLPHAQLDLVNLEGHDLQEAFLEGASLRKALLRRCRFDLASLREANLTSAILTEARFCRAMMDGAQLGQIQGASCDFSEASMNDFITMNSYPYVFRKRTNNLKDPFLATCDTMATPPATVPPVPALPALPADTAAADADAAGVEAEEAVKVLEEKIQTPARERVPTYPLANTHSPRTSFNDAHFGVADFQMRQAALTQKIQGSVSPNGNSCTYTRMSGAGSFCADGKDSDYGLADDQLEAKNRTAQSSSPTDGDTTAGFRYQSLPGEAAHATLPTLTESRSTEDAAEDASPGRASTSSACSFSAPDDLRFSSYRPASSATPFSAPFLDGPRPRRFRGLQCLERVKQCFMLSD